MTARRIRRFLLAIGLVVTVATTTSACSPNTCAVTDGVIVCPSPR